ncbi:polyketide synthase-related [Holotrichia oblita]|nr:polyketide synthase-related [Holotrichia oblita]
MPLALITGATQGIGAAIALRLASDGFNIAINDVNEAQIEKNGRKIEQSCRELGVEAECFAADVSKYDECKKMIEKIKERFKSIDVLVNNAGITRDGLLVRMPEENYDLVIAINQKSIFNMMKLVGAVMMKQKSGRIINLSSVAGLYGNAGQFNYSASKAAVIGMTKSASKELGSRGINVNAVAPGLIETPMTDALTDEQKKVILNQVSMKRYGKVEEIAGVVSFLAGKDSSYVTGQVIEISGGLSIKSKHDNGGRDILNKRVVISGLGIISPVGNNVNDFWENVKAGRHGFTLEEWFPGQSTEKNVKALVKDFNAFEYFDKKEQRRTDRITQYAVSAALQALKDAGSDFKDVDPYRSGVIIGSGIGGIGTAEEQIVTYHNKGSSRVSVFTIPAMIGNMAAGTVAIKTGFMGTNYCTVSACASSAHAIGEAFRAIKHGYLDVAISGGTEYANIGFAFAGFNNMHAVTRSTDPDRASIPFDKERSGFVLGDGAGILILEELEHALKRGANIYAEICGYGATCDAYHETSPDPDGKGGAKAMELAVSESGLKLTDINSINAHGTSTLPNDRTETAAIKTVFGEHAYKIAVNSTKSIIGHLLGAAGAAEAITCALEIKNGLVHGTAGYRVKDEECDLDYVTEGSRDMKITGVLSNSLGFGGHNATLCFIPFE